ncbi:ATP synthase F1 subunit delta [Fusobacterium sp. MFO224]|uniref:ATP synthase F1 subunit delta n=1 Tax=Fusobacterium sp. MFO224 TaxID=3378070 RepID=UPI0038549435
MSKKIIGRRYAEAIFSIAESNNRIEEVYKALNGMMEFYLTNIDLKNILDSPLILMEEKEKVVEKLVIEEEEVIKNIILYILSKERIQNIKEIVVEYAKIYYLKNKIIDVEAIFSQEISERQKSKLIKNLEKRTRKKINLKVTVDESIIGGGILKIGDKIIDGTIRNQLDSLIHKK